MLCVFLGQRVPQYSLAVFQSAMDFTQPMITLEMVSEINLFLVVSNRQAMRMCIV